MVINEEPEKDIISGPIHVHESFIEYSKRKLVQRRNHFLQPSELQTEMQAEMRVPLRHPAKECFTAVTKTDGPAGSFVRGPRMSRITC